MKHIKRFILRAFFGIELLVFVGIYFFGPHGWRALQHACEENNQVLDQINSLQPQLLDLEYKIVQWNTHPFYKEKIAREQLQMARNNEEIYLIS